ncbi:hypothetical protein J437_LFUL015660 [Ladona fulva]|uniref:DUF4817 domain-containing protein n=1 Tax=Ladona fulva TaxID=123851 RepID=A0A8K0KPX6_LADFU|nr:hypothetical protein J437_LFUL015660 [Ladona fulva]
MATGVKKAFCVLVFHETKSIVTVQRWFRGKYGKTPPNKPAIRAWYKRFVTESCVCKHMLQKLKPSDKVKQLDFCSKILEQLAVNDMFLDKLVFSYEATFNLSGQVNRQNIRIWGSENPQESFEHERNSPKDGDNPFLRGEKLPVAAKKGFKIRY